MKPSVKLYNTLTRQLESFEPQGPAGQAVKLYVCGPTVYDEAHLGHARCYITWDILYRFLKFCGYTVQYVRNITDVDDKILARARENGESPEALAQRFTQRFHAVMDRLHVLPPTDEPRATAYIPQMITLITGLLDKGIAYQGETTGTIYYDVSQKSDYGELCHQSLDDLQSGARVEVAAEKRSPLDFALWKPADKNEPAVWEAPWSWGRPGWHIECSAMSYALLGEQLDIHAGGLDLVFPHHQNEIAQSEAFTGKKPFAKYWLHNGFVNVSGEKMSKSLGNFSTVEAMLHLYDAETLRYFLLTHHYRSPVDFSEQALEGAKNRVTKIKGHLQRLANQGALAGLTDNPEAAIQARTAEPSIQAWIEAMASDLNTAQALSILDGLFDVAVSGKAADSEQALSDFLGLSQWMGFDFIPQVDLSGALDGLRAIYRELANQLTEEPAALSLETDSAETVLTDILEARALVREQKNWALSDWIRDELARLGITLQDRKGQLPAWTYEPKQHVSTPS